MAVDHRKAVFHPTWTGPSYVACLPDGTPWVDVDGDWRVVRQDGTDWGYVTPTDPALTNLPTDWSHKVTTPYGSFVIHCDERGNLSVLAA